MFKVPDWETDVPKTNVVFTKKATNKKFKNESFEGTSAQGVIKNTKIDNETKHTNATPFASNGSTNHKKKKPKKRKQKNDNEDIFVKESQGIEMDELLVSAKKKKLNEIYKKEDSEELLFGEDVKEFKPTVSKSPKKNKQKLKSGLSNNNNVNNNNKTLLKRKQSNDKDEEINSIIISAKKIKLNDTNTVKNGQTGNVKRNTHIIEKEKDKNKNNIVENKTENKKEINLHKSNQESEVSEKQETRNDSKKKEKIKKLLEQNHRTPINVTGNQLRERMMERLKAAQFRYLNEKLYTSSGNEAQEIFKTDPEAFRTYHEGFQLQVKKWPVNPLDVIVKRIKKLPKSFVIADMGCGEGALSKKVPQKVHSFDLVSTNPNVVACDMARTPLLRESVDVVVYCLALMGTELTQYLLEANRVLKNGGLLLIAEVESRFDDVNQFAKMVEKLGFKLTNLDKQHSVFFFLHFVKVNDPPVKKNKLPTLTLKPCLYKKR